MKKLLGIVAVGTAVALTGCQKTDNGQPTDTTKGTPVASMNEQEKASYALGVLMADNLKTELPNIQFHLFTAGLNDAYNGHSSMNTEESKNTFLGFQHKSYQEMVDRNLKEGQAFADKFVKEDGAKKTDTGIAYKVLASGDANGPQPTDSSNVEATYEGRHINGKVFDSSKDPVAFNMSQVIPGWREVVKQMHVGDEWEAVIPASKAYGEQGTGEGTIGPNETLVFKIKLTKVADNAQH